MSSSPVLVDVQPSGIDVNHYLQYLENPGVQYDYIAGLQAIPEQYYEAARIDGANNLVQFFKITIPLLAPITTFILIYNTILAFQVFDQVFVLTGGGPAYSTTVVVLELYQQAFLKHRFGYASAMAAVLFIIILGITIVQYAISKKKEIVY
ncbi:MAG: ABC transporter permease subunit [Firmicutes bacterium]|nr:ABC transporter permease subunit [Bacillota bacterium]